jgi:hypothetical protein
VFGIANLERLPYSALRGSCRSLLASWSSNLASLWLQRRTQKRMAGMLLTLSGSLPGTFSSSSNFGRHARSSGA